MDQKVAAIPITFVYTYFFSTFEYHISILYFFSKVMPAIQTDRHKRGWIAKVDDPRIDHVATITRLSTCHAKVQTSIPKGPSAAI
jgi:hypothetical protein